MWVFLVLLYGLFKGAREIAKKKALEKSGVMEVLFVYTLLSFLFVVPDAGNAMGLSGTQLLCVLAKSAVIFVAWICGFQAIARLPVSLYSVLDLSRVIFSTLLGVCFLGEQMRTGQSIGLVLVLCGLLLLKAPWKKKGGDADASAGAVALALTSCLMNALSGTMDKVLMRGMNSSQLQFWYMLFLTAMYGAYLLFSRTKIHWKGTLKNGWIWLMSALFVVADRALFLANGMPGSQVTVMTLLKQSGVLVSILGGYLVFHEKHVGYRLACASLVVAGIVAAVL